jgi:hypothetical protein
MTEDKPKGRLEQPQPGQTELTAHADGVTIIAPGRLPAVIQRYQHLGNVGYTAAHGCPGSRGFSPDGVYAYGHYL